MARKFRMDLTRKIVDRLMIWLIRRDRGPQYYYLLTVPGRRTGRLYTKPVALIKKEENQWLVAPYGSVDWVKNARAAGEVTISRGNKRATLAIHELPPEESAPILKEYLQKYPITAPYFNAKPDSPLKVFESEAKTRPVFLLHAREGE